MHVGDGMLFIKQFGKNYKVNELCLNGMDLINTQDILINNILVLRICYKVTIKFEQIQY